MEQEYTQLRLMNEIKKLKDRLSKINHLLDKLDERLIQGEITESKYQELSDKYRGEGDSLKNQIVETELLQEVGLNAEETEAVEYLKPEKKELLQEVGFKAEERENIEYPKPVKAEEPLYVKSEGGVLSAFLWMMLLSPFLFWIPFLGSFIVGFVGGKKAGNRGGAMLAGIIPIILMFVLGVVVFEDTDNGVIIASILLIPIIVVIGVILSSRTSKKKA